MTVSLRHFNEFGSFGANYVIAVEVRPKNVEAIIYFSAIYDQLISCAHYMMMRMITTTTTTIFAVDRGCQHLSALFCPPITPPSQHYWTNMLLL